jgi:hypothetical protein
MKTTFALLCLTACSFIQAHAQPAEAVLGATNQVRRTEVPRLDAPLTERQIEAMLRFQTDTVTRVLGVNVTVDGIVPQALRVRQPLQLINPLAPMEYGIGLEQVNVNPRTRRVEGLSFFTFRF